MFPCQCAAGPRHQCSQGTLYSKGSGLSLAAVGVWVDFGPLGIREGGCGPLPGQLWDGAPGLVWRDREPLDDREEQRGSEGLTLVGCPVKLRG